MNKILKNVIISFCLSLVCIVCVITNNKIDKSIATEYSYIKATETAYSTKTGGTRGTIFTDKDGISVRYLKDISEIACSYFFGVVLDSYDKTITVQNQALVIDLSVLYEGCFNIGINGKCSNFNIGSFGTKGQNYFFYKNNKYVKNTDVLNGYLSTVLTKTSSFDNTISEYNSIVVPLSNLCVKGESIDVKNVTIRNRFDSKPATKNMKYLIHNIYILDNFTPQNDIDEASLETIYIPEVNNYSEFVAGSTINSETLHSLIDVKFLRKGEAIVDSSNGTDTSYTYLKFPSSMIGEDGLVNLDGYKGFYFLLNADISDKLAFVWTLTDENNVIFNTYENNKSKRIFSGGTINTGSAKYITNNHNNVIYYFSFTACKTATTESNESFTSSAKFSGQKFKPYIHINLSNNQNVFNDRGVIIGLGNFTFVKDDKVYINNYNKNNSNASISISRKANMVGMPVNIKAIPLEGNKILDVKINNNSITQDELNELQNNGIEVYNNSNLDIEVNTDYKIVLNNRENKQNNYGTNIILPNTQENDKIFIGWKDEENNLYRANYNLILEKNMTLEAIFIDFGDLDGASIRVSSDGFDGIRFSSKINKEEYLNLKSIDNEISLGMSLYRGDNKKLDINVVNTIEDDGDIYFNGVIYNLTEEFYNVIYYGRGFINIKYFGDEYFTKIYSISSDNERTIQYIAQKAIEDDLAEWTSEQLLILNKYIGEN